MVSGQTDTRIHQGDRGRLRRHTRIYMLTYQYFRDWRSYTMAVIVLFAVIAFVIQPFLKWSGIYTPLAWPYTYAFLSAITIGLISRWLMVKIMGGEAAAVEGAKKGLSQG